MVLIALSYPQPAGDYQTPFNYINTANSKYFIVYQFTAIPGGALLPYYNNYTMVSNDSFDLYINSNLNLPSTLSLSILDQYANTLVPFFTPSTTEVYALSVTKGVKYMILFKSTTSGASSGGYFVNFQAKQLPTVKKFIPAGYTISTLPNCVTTFDQYLNPTFTFTNFQIIAGNNYNFTYGYEPIANGSFTATFSNTTLFTSPETINFNAGVSFVYAGQALVSGTFSFTLTINTANVGTNTYVDLLYNNASLGTNNVIQQLTNILRNEKFSIEQGDNEKDEDIDVITVEKMRYKSSNKH